MIDLKALKPAYDDNLSAEITRHELRVLIEIVEKAREAHWNLIGDRYSPDWCRLCPLLAELKTGR